MVILHYTAMDDDLAARDWLCSPKAEVSAHYMIGRDGTLWQLVDEAERAWHAGVGAWGEVDDVNSRSIGIELGNTGDAPFPEKQMTALERLLRGVATRWSIAPERVLGHSDTAVGRKVDPGPFFDWRRLANRGLAVWPEPAEPGDFAMDARAAGYRWPAGKEDAVLTALRLRFRPAATGPLADADRALMAGLARRYPCA
jgi:N-acetylmuramoyl-L-alanine amidase